MGGGRRRCRQREGSARERGRRSAAVRCTKWATLRRPRTASFTRAPGRLCRGPAPRPSRRKAFEQGAPSLRVPVRSVCRGWTDAGDLAAVQRPGDARPRVWERPVADPQDDLRTSSDTRGAAPTCVPTRPVRIPRRWGRGVWHDPEGVGISAILLLTYQPARCSPVSQAPAPRSFGLRLIAFLRIQAPWQQQRRVRKPKFCTQIQRSI